MVSLSKSKAAAEAAQYFSKESYYAHETEDGYWFGRGAQALDLHGAITKDDFIRTLNGVDKNYAALTKNTDQENRNAYFDMTMSAPKSVSILSYADERIEQAHNQAVRKALGEVESHFVNTRAEIHKGEGVEFVKADAMACGVFNHRESRELDPQLHSHCVVMNLALDGEKWRTLQNSEIYKNQHYIDSVYKSELAKNLKEIGYEIQITNRQHGSFEIKGIEPEIIDEFCKRRHQILAVESEYLKDGKFQNLTEAERRQMACLDSREYKSDVTIQQVREMTEGRLKEYETSLEQIKGKVLDSSRSPDQTPQRSPEQHLQNAIEGLSENHSAFTREALLREALNQSMGHHTKDDMERAMSQSRDLVELGTRGVYIQALEGLRKVSEARCFTSQEIQRTEQRILDRVNHGRDQAQAVAPAQEVSTHIEKIEREGFKLSEGQKKAVETVCSSKDRYIIIQGDAGAGKTTAVDQVRQIMEAQGFEIRGFAPTGKAAESLKTEGQIKSDTVDHYLTVMDGGGKTDNSRPQVWILDEAGMMGSRKLDRFLDYAEQNHAKVVLMGDRKQFQPIEQGKIFQDIQDKANAPFVEITEVHRQKTAHMKEIVSHIKARDFDKAFDVLDTSGSVRELADSNERKKIMVGEYLTDRGQGKEAVILASTNKDRQEINQAVRTSLVRDGSLEQGRGFEVFQGAGMSGTGRTHADQYKEGQYVFFQNSAGAIRKGTQAKILSTDTDKNALKIEYWDKKKNHRVTAQLSCPDHGRKIQAFNAEQREFSQGDKIIFLKNNRALNVKNGELGVIRSIDKDGNVSAEIGRNRREVIFNLNNRGDRAYNYVDHAYAITSYKAQGSSIDKVICEMDTSKKISFNEFYVAATRARQDISLYADDKTRLQKQVSFEQNKTSTLDTFTLKPIHLDQNRALDRAMEGIDRATKEFRTERTRELSPTRPERSNEKNHDHGLSI